MIKMIHLIIIKKNNMKRKFYSEHATRIIIIVHIHTRTKECVSIISNRDVRERKKRAILHTRGNIVEGKRDFSIIESSIRVCWLLRVVLVFVFFLYVILRTPYMREPMINERERKWLNESINIRKYDISCEYIKFVYLYNK